ncbi:MAG: amidase [Alphaproteobacteria bacterium]|nr:MAG: amidase [Alphaproteobacteria bacterium]
MDDLTKLTAADAARRIESGEITSERLVQACLDRIAAREETVRAWAYLDPDYALKQARERDEWRKQGRTTGPLHGVPVGIKDIIDTGDMPTENGCAAHKGRTPEEDATLVAALRDAGAVIMGKTVTTELAVFVPSKTRNPHNPEYSPGGSSAGSAAAVADFMVPLAVGTQTGGSVIRPASFNGVVGFKPTFGLISRKGVLAQSPALDTVGVFARTVEDSALIAELLTAYDPADADMKPRSRPRLREVAIDTPPVTPMLAFVKGPTWDKAEKVTEEAFAELVEALGEQCDTFDLPPIYHQAPKWQKLIQTAEVGKYFGPLLDHAADGISDPMKEMIAEGRTIPAHEYITAKEFRDVLYAGLEEIFERYDAILTPASPGPAPKGFKTTGDPCFNAMWTYLGTPAVTVPLLDVDGLPLGVQLVGPRLDDGRLLRTARWLAEHLAQGTA